MILYSLHTEKLLSHMGICSQAPLEKSHRLLPPEVASVLIMYYARRPPKQIIHWHTAEGKETASLRKRISLPLPISKKAAMLKG